jgi:squalene synthase HpnD
MSLEEEYCQQKAATAGSNAYYSLLFLPAEQRRAVTALYAFLREVQEVVEECQDPGVARLKLHWWQQEIGKSFTGNPNHPVAIALVNPVRHCHLALEYFYEVINGAEKDLDSIHFPSFTELAQYCHRLFCIVEQLVAQVLGYQDPRTLEYAHTLGLALQLSTILKSLRRDVARGRLYIPQDELERFGVSPQDLIQANTSDRVHALLLFQGERIRDYLHQAYAVLPDEDCFRQHSGLIMARIELATLEEIARAGYRVLEQRIELTPIRKLWIAWRTVRRERRRHARTRRRERSVNYSL